MIIDKNIEIKNVSNVIFFDNNFAEKKRNFKGKVPCNELIFKLSGETKIQFDNETFYDKEGSLRFLPKIDKEVISQLNLLTEPVLIYFLIQQSQ